MKYTNNNHNNNKIGREQKYERMSKYATRIGISIRWLLFVPKLSKGLLLFVCLCVYVVLGECHANRLFWSAFTFIDLFAEIAWFSLALFFLSLLNCSTVERKTKKVATLHGHLWFSFGLKPA